MNNLNNLNNLILKNLKKLSLDLNLTLDDQKCEKLLNFIDLLIKWNKTYNLTAIRDPEKILTHHILDSLSIANYLINKKNILDVGSGAGLPGIPLAIFFPRNNLFY